MQLTTIFIVGLAIAYTVRLVRALAHVHPWMAPEKRPWGCNVCMSFWSALAFEAARAIISGELHCTAPLALLAEAGVALVLLTWLDTRAPAEPPELP